jgi:hypothetical protein
MGRRVRTGPFGRPEGEVVGVVCGEAGGGHLEDPSSPPGQLQPLLTEGDEAVAHVESQRLPGLRRVAEDDHRSSQTVVPSRSYTRRPSVSHFATPSSP